MGFFTALTKCEAAVSLSCHSSVLYTDEDSTPGVVYSGVGLNQSCPWDYLQVSAQTLGPIGATILEWDRLACASESIRLFCLKKISRVHKVKT